MSLLARVLEELAPGAPVCVLRAAPGVLDGLAPGVVLAEQTFRPAFTALERAGYDVAQRREGPFAATAVALTRHKAENRANIARAWAMTAPGGLVLAAGAKTDGIESLQKSLRPLIEGVRPGGHGRVFWMRRAEDAPEVFAGWLAEAAPAPRIEDRWTTQAGVFSWTGVDPGSALLAETAAGKIGGKIADLGAGWGYLSARLLEDPAVAAVDLFEAEALALDCAAANISDPRAGFHWADVAAETPRGVYDAVISNPPFHEGRAVSISLGHGFLEAGAAALKPKGDMWIVANRTLPYEAPLEGLFKDVERTVDARRYKVLRARRPKRR